MESIHKRCIITHFWRHRSKQVTNTLLVFYVNFEVSDHHDTSAGSNPKLTRCTFVFCFLVIGLTPPALIVMATGFNRSLCFIGLR